MAKGHFYLSEWKPEGDGEVCHLMQRRGAEDGRDAIVAEFSRYPHPLGEQLAQAALANVYAYAEANPDGFDADAAEAA